ncbi:MAG: DAK2 domain-containing protein [Acholeplasmatales bacterium]|nr:DAK2 domain-containing protein [Acholeplasmatales bacterium]
MSVSSVDVALFKKMMINGAINLQNHRADVDQLNVFPVPDGDTGTNMSMTITSGIREIEACESSSIIDNAKVLSRGALMGARGNSGVILSQFFRGFYVGLKELQHNFLNVEDFINCLDSGCKIAYKAVMTPIEGTILTVIREAVENVKNMTDGFSSIDDLLDAYVHEASKSLANTPNLLPVLKEAKVVDSGGAGFLSIIEGMNLALKGEILEVSDGKKEEKSKEVKFRNLYKVSLVVELKKPSYFDAKELKASLSLLGDTVGVTKEDGNVNIHLNTNRPGRALELVLKVGTLLNIEIDNRKVLQFKPAEEAPKAEAKPEAKPAEETAGPKKDFALIAVCFGSGIVETFKELGVDYVIEGGQTMNPSTEAFVDAIKKVNAKNVIIIPNNGNVVMAAKQASSMVKDCNVEVILAKTIAQGYASLVAYNPEATMEENLEAMGAQIANVTSGEITYSIRDTEIGGVKIASGDYMGISNGEILVSKAKKDEVLHDLLSRIITDDSEVITLFYGKDVKDEEVALVEKICLDINSNLDVELISGQQDIYSYIIAVE